MTDGFSLMTEAHARTMFDRVRNARNSEATTILTVELLLRGNQLARVWDLPEIEGWKFEVPTDGGRIDALLTHVDGSHSIVEAKGDLDSVEISRGIGQLFHYAATFGRPARLILCSCASVAKAFNAIRACELAGVQYGFLPSYDDFRILTAKHRAH